MTKFARVFFEKSGVSAIVVTMHRNQDGIWYEDNAPTILPQPVTAEALGRTVMNALDKTGNWNANLRSAKLADWPSFKASGMRVVRQFEQSYIALTVKGANDANLVAIIEGEPEKDAELRVTTSVSTAVCSIRNREKSTARVRGLSGASPVGRAQPAVGAGR